MIGEATADCYNDDEAFWGFLACVEQHVTFPFEAVALGDEVLVVGFDQKTSGPRKGIRVQIRKGGRQFKVAVTDLELPAKFEGRDWLEAYRWWEGLG